MNDFPSEWQAAAMDWIAQQREPFQLQDLAEALGATRWSGLLKTASLVKSLGFEGRHQRFEGKVEHRYWVDWDAWLVSQRRFPRPSRRIKKVEHGRNDG